MREIPEGFIIPKQYGAVNQGVANVSTYSGVAAGRPFEFKVIKQRNAKKSMELGYEVDDEIEVVEFLNDEKCTYCPRIDADLFANHPEILPEYTKWKTGVESGITEIKDWDGLSWGEMGTLIARGFRSVEQIESATEVQLQTIGLNWKDIKRKADLHMATKRRARGEIQETEQVSNLILEAQTAKARSAEMEAEMVKMREQLEMLMASKTVEKVEVATVAPKKVAVKKAPTRTPGVQS